MSQNNNENKDISNSLSELSDVTNKSVNIGLDAVSQINIWYEGQLDKIIQSEEFSTRLGTKVDNLIEEQEDLLKETQVKDKVENSENRKIETKVNNKDIRILNSDKVSRIKTAIEINEFEDSNEIEDIEFDIDIEENEIKESKENVVIINNTKRKKINKIAAIIKSAKVMNNVTNKVIKTGKSINTGLNEGSLKTFEHNSSRIMTKPVKQLTRRITKKATNIISKSGKKVVTKVGKKAIQKTTNAMVKVMKVLTKLVMDVAKLIVSMLPQIAPVLIIILIIACLCNYFGIDMSDETKELYEDYMIATQKEYDNITLAHYNKGKVVEGAIEGKGMINWRAPLSVIQILNGELLFDDAERELLNTFKNADLFETITDATYTYEKKIEETDKDGNKTTKTEIINETKKVVNNPGLDDYLKWCNDNFEVINEYKMKKNVFYDNSQTAFTESEVEQIELLYNSDSFFELFSDEFQSTYTYAYVNIENEQLQAIYDEFLKNAGKRYLMDHSNLKYDECMEYYDCSSWVIHVLRTYWYKNNTKHSELQVFIKIIVTQLI